MAGLLDPNEDFISPDERKAITQQNLFSTLLQGGMQLVAGGENLLPWQRAQMIGQAAQTFGGMPAQNQKMLANAAQQKLVGQKYADKKRESQILSSDDFKTALSQLPPEMQALARINPQGAIAAVSNYRQSQAQAKREEAAGVRQERLLQAQFDRQAEREDATGVRQERLLQAQFDRQPPTVKNDEYGRLVAYDPATRSWRLVNMGGGDQRSAYGLPGGAPAQQGGGGVTAPAPNAATSATVPVDNTADYTNAFGTSGWYHKAANTVRGIFDGPTEENAKAQNAQDNWTQVRLSAIKALATEVPGRNSKYAAQVVSNTLPHAAAFFTSPDTAISQIKAAQNTIDGEIASLESGMKAPGNVQNRAKIAENLRDLYRVRENLQTVAEKVKPAPQQKAPEPNNITPAQAEPASGPTPQQAIEELRRRGKIQ